MILTRSVSKMIANPKEYGTLSSISRASKTCIMRSPSSSHHHRVTNKQTTIDFALLCLPHSLATKMATQSLASFKQFGLLYNRGRCREVDEEAACVSQTSNKLDSHRLLRCRLFPVIQINVHISKVPGVHHVAERLHQMLHRIGLVFRTRCTMQKKYGRPHLSC